MEFCDCELHICMYIHIYLYIYKKKVNCELVSINYKTNRVNERFNI